MTLTIANLRRDLTDAQTAHAVVAAATTGATRPLWAKPDRRHLIVRHDLPTITLDPYWVSSATHADESCHDVGDQVAMSLIAAPTMSMSRGEGVRGKRVSLPAEQWQIWLQRKLGDALTLGEIRADLMPSLPGRRQGKTVTHTRVCFHADATVTDADQLHELIAAGVGSGKGYGCGLLLVRGAK